MKGSGSQRKHEETKALEDKEKEREYKKTRECASVRSPRARRRERKKTNSDIHRGCNNTPVAGALPVVELAVAPAVVGAEDHIHNLRVVEGLGLEGGSKKGQPKVSDPSALI